VSVTVFFPLPPPCCRLTRDNCVLSRWTAIFTWNRRYHASH
jgi:hypothetical protein